MNSSELIQKARIAIDNGNRAQGQTLLFQVLQSDPQNEEAWLCLCDAVDDVNKKRDCLNRVLTINPNSQAARRKLESLVAYGGAKKCPYCAEEIKQDAIVCKHCGRDLTTPPISPQQRGELARRLARYEAEIERLNRYIGECDAEIEKLRRQGSTDTIIVIIGLLLTVVGIGLLILVAGLLAASTRRAKIRKLESARRIAGQRIEKLRYFVTQIKMDPEGALTADHLSEENVQRVLSQFSVGEKTTAELRTGAKSGRNWTQIAIIILVLFIIVACVYLYSQQ